MAASFWSQVAIKSNLIKTTCVDIYCTSLLESKKLQKIRISEIRFLDKIEKRFNSTQHMVDARQNSIDNKK